MSRKPQQNKEKDEKTSEVNGPRLIDPRDAITKAESLLEQVRKTHPNDLSIINPLVELYEILTAVPDEDDETDDEKEDEKD